MARPLLILCLLLWVGGCVVSKPYEPPQFIGAQTFPGARTVAGNGGRVRVIMAHGMCSGLHKYYGNRNWVANRAALIARAIGDDSFRPRDYTPTREFPDVAGRPSAVQRIDIDLTGADDTIYEMSFLLWGDTFDIARNDIDRVDLRLPDGARPERAPLNEMLKERLMNDCFVDAVAYSGPRGNVVRRNMRAAMCDLMGGSIKGRNDGRPSETVTCTGLDTQSDTPVIMVPESLGAKVVMDAFLALDDSAGGRRKAQAIGPVRAIHLATHQLPLLDTAELRADDPTPSRDGDQRAYLRANRALAATRDSAEPSLVGDFLSMLGPSTRSRNAKLALVVYYDPNDMFGYPLSAEVLPSHLNLSLTNVLVSNASTYLGLGSNPLASHQNTARPGVADIIVNGSAARD